MPMYKYRYTVEGSSALPIDMLRHDGSFPADQEAVAVINQMDSPHKRGSMTDTVTVDLITHRSHEDWEPNSERWESFGWSVVCDSLEVDKIN